MNIISIYEFIIILLFTVYVTGRQSNLLVKITTMDIKIDVVLDEAAWGDDEISSDFWQYFPFVSARRIYQTYKQKGSLMYTNKYIIKLN